MGEEMKDCILRPITPQQFLDENFPTNNINHYGHGVAGGFHAGCYKDTVAARVEKDAYDPFVSL
jgi:hypothetical protein